MKGGNDCSGLRIFIVDDHPVVRQGLRLLFTQASLSVCGETESMSTAIELISGSGADLAILDLSLGEDSGLDLIEGIRAQHCAVLVYSMHEDAATIEQALGAGAKAYVSKRENEDILLKAVAEVANGSYYLSPLATRSMERQLAGTTRKPMLSERESTILTHLGQGDSNSEIAAALAISIRTVETYCARLATKLELDGMRALRRYAIRRSLRRRPE